MSFTEQLPLVFRGDLQVPNLSLRDLTKPRIDARGTEVIRGMYEGSSLEAAVDEGFSVRDDVMRGMAQEMDAASRGTVTAKGFELEARRIARLMLDRYDLGFVDVAGWDTHTAQGGAKGALSSKLAKLWAAIAGFAEVMGPQWRDTVVIVVSEFGRPLRENGNGGTDHGHGSVYWVLGGSLRGGRIVGEQVRVAYDTLFEKRDYPVLNEYREVIGGVLARMYGLDAARMAKIFPGAQPRELGLV
jgi:uncharacterized protein (DUF1501 family)